MNKIILWVLSSSFFVGTNEQTTKSIKFKPLHDHYVNVDPGKR